MSAPPHRFAVLPRLAIQCVGCGLRVELPSDGAVTSADLTSAAAAHYLTERGLSLHALAWTPQAADQLGDVFPSNADGSVRVADLIPDGGFAVPSGFGLEDLIAATFGADARVRAWNTEAPDEERERQVRAALGVAGQ